MGSGNRKYKYEWALVTDFIVSEKDWPVTIIVAKKCIYLSYVAKSITHLGMQLNALHCIKISKQHFISLKRIRIRFKIKEGQNKLQIHRRIILHVVKKTHFHKSGNKLGEYYSNFFSFNFVFDKYVNHKPVSLVMLYSFSIIQYIVIDHLFVFWVLNCQGTSLVYIISFLNLSNSITEILTSFFVFCICIFVFYFYCIL